MAQTTEAACLLQLGSSYASRIGLRRPSGAEVFAGIKAGGVSVYFDDEPIYHLDFDGRWQRAFVSGVHYLKGLDPAIRAVAREREGANLVLRRRTLPEAEAIAFDASVRRMALDLIADLDADRLELLAPPEPARAIDAAELREFLSKIAAWDAPAWASYRDRYRAAYTSPLPFLPPDCPNALVLQATHGRAFARGEAAAPPAGDFERHARAVADLLGGRIAQCRDVFVGGADFLRRPVDAILADLAATALVFPIRPKGAGDDRLGRFGAIHAYLDDFRPPLPDLDGWRRLREAHLGRVTLGIDPIDPAPPADLARTIAGLKAAGIGVGLVLPSGAGGRASAPLELESAPGLLAALPLGPGDLISLVDARDLLDPAPTDPLDDADAEAHAAALKARIAAALPSKGPRVVVYNPDKRWT